MKQKFLLVTLLCCGFIYNTAKANETEPNNDRAHANTLALNGNNSGAINPAGDQDWWKITTTGDGKLDVTLTPSGNYTWIYLYDNDGTTLLNSNYSTGTFTVSQDGLAAGTYYVKVVCFYNTETTAYTISDALTQPTQANDAEPNNSKAQALTLPQNGNKTGHVGYYYTNYRDTADWYKITTNGDGLLSLSLTPANGKYVWIYLYDNDGTTLLNSGYSTSAFNVNTDGLAAGTYFIKVICYYNTEFAPYTLSNTLTKPSDANDTEPNDTKAQAITLALNDKTTGHTGYYYNNHRDSADWYKLTTNSDGRLRLTMTSANGQNVWAYLFDNNATTPIASGYTSGSAVVVDQDGLAAGTYYIRVNTYYASEFAPYTLADSLFKPSEANDAEPDSSKATALTLLLNGSVTGHVNYYYNNHRDSVDEYKLTTSADGNINLSLSIPNGTPTWFALYDNDGTTLIHQEYTSGSLNYNVDGLSKGTYYIKVFTYYNYQFAPYTLKNTLTTYSAEDPEPNKYAKQASTLPANQTTTGHVNFYYNNVRDTVDWFKINYTGTGNMSVALTVVPNITGAAQPTWMQIYKDTTASAIYSAYTTGTETASLTGLAQGYYYVRIFEYYNYQFTAYTVTPSFTQVNKAAIKATAYDTSGSCASTNYITFQSTKSSTPYTVQLYRFGTAYGSPVVTNKNVTFSDLPSGSYYATAYGDGATGNAFGTSKTISIEPIPTGLNTTGIKSTQAKLNWNSVTCAGYFVIEYKVHGTSTWTTKKSKGNVTSYVLKSLTPGTTYDWEVAAADSANGITATSAFADSVVFTTSTSLIADESNSEEDLSINKINLQSTLITVTPNPAVSYFVIHYNSNAQNKVNALVYNANGKAIWSSGLINANTLNGKQVNASQFAKGVFYLKIINEQGQFIGSTKIIIAN